MKPNFLIIGAAKCGTTTLHHELSKHPDIYISPKKDFKFFDNDQNYQKGLDFYSTYFNGIKNEKKVGEVNSEYLFSKEAANRIKKDLGKEIKLIVILREPAERSFSEYKHQKKYDRTDKPFDYFLDESNLLSEKDRKLFSTIIERSQYQKHLQHYFNIFPKENIKIVILEKLIQNPNEINNIFKFLKVKQLVIEDIKQTNKAYEPKNKRLNHMVLRPNRFLRILIPSFKIRKFVRKSVKKMNSKTSTTMPLQESKKKYLLKNYFSGQKKYIEEHLQDTINEWV